MKASHLSLFKKIKIPKRAMYFNTSIYSKQDQINAMHNVLRGAKNKAFNNIDRNRNLGIHKANNHKLIGLQLVRKFNGIAKNITDDHVKRVFDNFTIKEKPKEKKKTFFGAKWFDGMYYLNKTEIMEKNKNNKQFKKTYNEFSKIKYKPTKPELKLNEKRYEEPYMTKNFFIPDSQYMKLRKTNEKNVKKIFSDASKSYLSTDISNTTKSNRKNNVSNQYNETEESLIKVNINDVDSKVSVGRSRVQPIINKYFGTKKSNKTKLILNKKKIKKMFDQLEEGYNNELNAMPEDKAKKEETVNSSTISNAKELERYNKQMKEIERQERKLAKNNFFKNTKKHKENLEDYDPNAQLFDAERYNNSKKNKNKRTFITALEKGKLPFNKIQKKIKKSIANDIRKDFLLRGYGD